MGNVVVINHLTLDGVMQAPGHADEDRRDGFAHGGWAQERSEQVMGNELGKWMRGEHVFLFGRVSYEGMLSGWNERGGPFMEALNGTRKYVASRDPDAKLQWPNSTLLTGDIPAEVARLKDELDEDLVMMGSGELIGALMEHGLVDTFLLMTHPIVLGTGRRLFAGDAAATLRLSNSVTTPTGVVVATYESAPA